MDWSSIKSENWRIFGFWNYYKVSSISNECDKSNLEYDSTLNSLCYWYMLYWMVIGATLLILLLIVLFYLGCYITIKLRNVRFNVFYNLLNPKRNVRLKLQIFFQFFHYFVMFAHLFLIITIFVLFYSDIFWETFEHLNKDSQSQACTV